MIEGRPFLYQAQDQTVYHVNENGVQAIWFWPSNKDIVAFVDDGKNSNEPHSMLLQERVAVILASSPKGTRAGWIKQAGFVKTAATKLWSPRELLLAGFVSGLLILMLD